MAVFGDTTAGGDTFPCSNDRAVLARFQAPEDGTLTAINVRFDSSSASGANFKGLIYADSAGPVPGARLGIGDVVAVPAGGGDLQSGSLSVAIVAGAWYWIGAVTSDFQSVFQLDASPANGSRMEATTYAAPAATWSQAGTTSGQLNAYATYTPAPPPIVDFPIVRSAGGAILRTFGGAIVRKEP